MSLYGTFLNESYNETILIESVQNDIEQLDYDKKKIMEKFSISDNDIQVGRNFLNKNPEIKSKLEKCKSIVDIIKLVNSSLFKNAAKEDN